MKYFPYTFFPLLFPFFSVGQTNPTDEQNYVRQISYQTALTESQVDAINDNNSPVDNDKKIESIVYYDGLGRPKQSVSVRAGGNRQDLVTPIQYDALGRQPKDWLPLRVLGNDGAFIQNVTTPLLEYYYNQYPESRHLYVINPYSEKHFEDSPLNRVLELGAPGDDWEIDFNADTDHTIKFGYGFNSGSEIYKFYVTYDVTGSNVPTLHCDGSTHTVNTLYRKVTKDENWQPSNGSAGTTIEFVDKQGRTLLKRQLARDPGNQIYNLDTYYIYDDFGNLVYVLSPKGTPLVVNNNGLISGYDTILNKLCYRYIYDKWNRLIEKKVPGTEWEYIVYDVLDRPVLTQDANMRSQTPSQWLFTKYDRLGRVAYTGIWRVTGGSREAFQAVVNTVSNPFELRTTTATSIGDALVYYSNTNTYPSAPLEVLSINYYDEYVDYTVPGNNGLTLPTTVMLQNTTEHPSVTTTTKGLPTVSRVRVLGQTPAKWITSLTAYDSRGRAIYSDSYNEYLQSREIKHSKLDLITGRLLESQSTHKKEGQIVRNTYDYFMYDHMGRLLSQKQKINTSPLQLIAENQYDELGQLVVRNVGGETEFDGYTLTLAEATFDGTLTKSETTDLWDSGAKTKGRVVGNGGINFTVTHGDKLLRAGLLLTTNANNSWTTGYDYGLYFMNTDTGNDGHKDFKVIINGVELATIYEYDAGDIFTITRTGTTVTFRQNNGPLPFLTLTSQPTAGLVGKVSFKSTGAQVTGLELFGGNIDKKLQQVDYAYNIRGWLTDINDIEASAIGTLGNVDLFNFRINYNTLEGNATNAPLYNGNIAQTLWKTVNTDTKVRGYAYTYDDLNRITKAKSYKGAALGTMASVVDHDVDNIDFDRNGNILSIKRWGANENGTLHDVWDNLHYTYDGNRLTNVLDTPGTSTLSGEGFYGQVYNPGTQYNYDANGNMVDDTNKGIKSIAYNHLNLPTIIRFNAGNTLTNSISYIYDATGSKLAKITNVNNATVTTQYDGGFIYNNAGSGQMQLQFFSQPEGYVKPVSGTLESVDGFDKDEGSSTSSAYKYVFQYKDHLGNVRLSYSDSDLNGSINPTMEIIEESNYYPFGLEQKGYNNTISPIGNALAQQWKYNGTEFDKSLNLNMYDLGARQVDPALGRFMVVDPLADFMNSQSPYALADNNPIANLDEYGLASNCWICRLYNSIFVPTSQQVSSANGRSSQRKSRATNWDIDKRKERKKEQPKPNAPSEGYAGPKLTIDLDVNLDYSPLTFENMELPKINTLNARLPIINRPKNVDIIIGGQKRFAGQAFKANIAFEPSTTVLDDDSPSSIKIINDLVKTLKTYPFLRVEIQGNIWRPEGGNSNTKFDSSEMKNETVGGFQLKRARAILNALKAQGINTNRIKISEGAISKSSSGASTTIIIK